MSSVRTQYAQRNTNLTRIVPRYLTTISETTPFADLTDIALYSLDIPNVANRGGAYFVDLSEDDTAEHSLDFDGQFETTGSSHAITRMIAFSLNAEASVGANPGLDFTIFFKNQPLNLSGDPLVSIGLIARDGTPIPYIVSPVLPTLLAPRVSQSLTFKSDGNKYNVISSGPAGWLSFYQLALLLGTLP